MSTSISNDVRIAKVDSVRRSWVDARVHACYFGRQITT
jgi:hypothetical protein